jgi:DMSO/TMAO reductase YedYZ molybdopterin-dependent catalytic subunit
MKIIRILTLFIVFLSACAVRNTHSETLPSAATATLPPVPTATMPAPVLISTQSADGSCDLQPVIVPTLPSKIPQTAQMDTTTGLHMTGRVQVIDVGSYRLTVSGKVDRPLSLSYDDLRCMPKVTATSDLVCPGVFEDTATWSGVPIKDVLDKAGVQPDAKTVQMKGADGYDASISVAMALNPHYYLAYEWEGKPLPIQHGFPLRAVFPGQPGSQWVKWLLEIIVK